MAHPISLQPSPDSAIRHATRLLSMVHELHKAGYQRVRFSSGMAPNGVHWRCAITHSGNIGPDGFSILSAGTNVAHYSSGAGDRYFNWPDAPGRSARELAAFFLERFAPIAQLGDGSDWAYAGWLTEILGRAERDGAGGLPVFFADYPVTPDFALPPPPPGSADARRFRFRLPKLR